MDIPNLRWWGWGTLDHRFPLEDPAHFWQVLQTQLGLPGGPFQDGLPPLAIEEIALQPSRLDGPLLCSLRRLIDADAVETGTAARVMHAYGKSYRDLIRLRAGYIPDPPDAVVYPADPGQVASLLAWAADREIAVIPFGGGSSITGGVEPLPGDQISITLDLARLNRLLSVDAASRSVRVQAGILGPALESELGVTGFTLGHFPESFGFSTLGGWIATRGVGYNSIGYGGIEQMTQSVRMVTPVGVVETKGPSWNGAGSSLLQTLVGSEGAYGVITEATMLIHPRPEVQDCRGVLFGGVADGLAACRDLAQSGDLRPSIVQLYDAPGMVAFALTSDRRHGLRRLAGSLVNGYLKTQGYDFGESSLLFLSFEGESKSVGRLWDRALELCSAHRGVSLGRAVGQAWLRERFLQPYLRDDLIAHGAMIDTLDTSTNWSNMPHLYTAVVSAMKGAISATGGGAGYVTTQLSHITEHGAVLHATFLGRQVATADPLVRQAQAQAVKQATIEATLAAGGTLSHHGPGSRPADLWPDGSMGAVGTRVARALKQAFDPAGIMNPIVHVPS
jgi:alkyldihydroxyacetonephosphate synthase